MWKSTEHLVNTLSPETATVSGANLVHNLARLALVKKDFPRAEELIDKAIALYGDDTHIHHRAAANYWKSVIFLKQDRVDDAREARVESLDLWEQQLAKDPESPEFQNRVREAQANLAELAPKSE